MTPLEAKIKVALRHLPPTYSLVIDELGRRTMTLLEIAAFLGMTEHSTWKLLQVLRKEAKVVCIAEFFYTDQGRRSHRFGLGSRDVRAPAKKTDAERTKAWRERKKVVRLGMLGI